MNNKSPCHYLQAGGPNRKWVLFTLEALPVPAGVQDEGNSLSLDWGRKTPPMTEVGGVSWRPNKCQVPFPCCGKTARGQSSCVACTCPSPPHRLYPPSSFYKQARGKYLGSHCRFLHLPMRKTNLSKHRMVSIYSDTKIFFYAESDSNSKPNSYPYHRKFFPSACVCQHWASFFRCLPSFP